MQCTKEESNIFVQVTTLITERKNDEAKSILQNTNLHLKTNNAENLTLLHIACKTGNNEMAQYLIDLGSDIDAKTISGLTPILFAVDNRHTSIVKMLLDANCNTADIAKFTTSRRHESERINEDYDIAMMIALKQEENTVGYFSRPCGKTNGLPRRRY